MRSVLTALTFLAACGPSHEPRSEQSWRVITGETAHAEAARAWAEIANAPQAIGEWNANADETRAEFGDDAGPLLAFGCDRGFLQFERILPRPHGFAPGRRGPQFTILSPRERINYFATAAADRSPRLWLAAPRGDFRLDDFVASEAGFAIQTAGDTTRFPHHPMLARVLANCRAG